MLGRERKIRRHKKAPEAPKKAMTAYILFSKHVRDQMKQDPAEANKVLIFVLSLIFSQQATEVVKIVAQRWSVLNEEEKRPFIEAAERDKDRYTFIFNLLKI